MRNLFSKTHNNRRYVNKRKELFCFLFVCISFASFGQPTKIRGTVTDAETNEPLPFVNISFIGTNIGGITDFDGNYFLETRNEVDSLQVSYLGYEPQKIKVNKHVFQTKNFKLQPTSIALEEIVVLPGENPAFRILRNINKNKEKNNPAKYKYWECEVYNKMEIDVNNIDEDFKKQRVFKHFQFIFDYVDTSAVTGKSYLPVFISETLSDMYVQKKPHKKKELIKANRISGVENESVMQYTGHMYIEVNAYDNFIPVFGKQFVSPIANVGRAYYKYYLIDSSYINNKYCYQISFKPRRKQEPTFTGDFWVHDTTWALTKVKVRIAEDANINFVNDLVATQEFQQIGDSVWFLKRDHLFVDFNLKDSTTGFFGRKTTTYKNVVVNKAKPAGFFDDKARQITISLEGANKRDSVFWATNRHEKLSIKEENIYNMVDSIKEVPVFRTFVDLITLFVSGYHVWGNFEFGPYYTFYSFNEIEGNRFRLGGRTSKAFSTKIRLNGHLAYGTKDEKFKYRLGAMYLFSKRPRTTAGFQYQHDMEQLGLSDNAFMMDNILSSVLQREPVYKLTMLNEFSTFYEKEWHEGFSNKISYRYRKIHANEHIPFQEFGTDHFLDNIVTSEIKLNTRYAYNEKFVYGEFQRVSLGTKFPVVNIDLILGMKDVFGGDYSYFKTNINIQHDFNINPIGHFNSIIEAGKIWGKLPYPLLKLHEGNETYAFDDFAFNMMNYYEFASDRYAGLYCEHHFEGLFLNKIPLFRKLKWREVIYGKGLIGRISESNKKVMYFPKGLTDLSKKPYYEAGIGIENIFKIIRIDAIWRLSYLNQPNIQKFGIRAKLQIVF
ncbi:MAG: hypothetical protein CSA05_00810 [Bacteroidia bacterium]|nr:MAG: hypothetical protein CSA05_00810 [Bacteroidia bacterium]